MQAYRARNCFCEASLRHREPQESLCCLTAPRRVVFVSGEVSLENRLSVFLVSTHFVCSGSESWKRGGWLRLQSYGEPPSSPYCLLGRSSTPVAFRLCSWPGDGPWSCLMPSLVLEESSTELGVHSMAAKAFCHAVCLPGPFPSSQGFWFLRE